MRRARIYLAIVAYHIFVKRFLNKSFQAVFYRNSEQKDTPYNTYKIKPQIFKFNRLDHFFIHNDSCNIGLHTGFLSQFLII
jgi:hypothetical protein